jgi:hypothetical protein
VRPAQSELLQQVWIERSLGFVLGFGEALCEVCPFGLQFRPALVDVTDQFRVDFVGNFERVDKPLALRVSVGEMAR